MECNNCGWFNPQGLTRCQKCNQPLKVEDLVKEEQQIAKCVQCGYLLSAGVSSCPNCGYPCASARGQFNQPLASDTKATVVLDNQQPVMPQRPANPKATVILNDSEPKVESPRVNNPKATVILGNQEPVMPQRPANPKATVILNDSEPVAASPRVNNPKATVILGNQEPVMPQRPANPKATVILNNSEPVAASPQVQNPKATVVLDNPTPVVNTKQTVRDVNFMQKPYQPETEVAKNEYKLVCMDKNQPEPLTITLTASEPIDLKSKDIILIAGLRYCVE